MPHRDEREPKLSAEQLASLHKTYHACRPGDALSPDQSFQLEKLIRWIYEVREIELIPWILEDIERVKSLNDVELEVLHGVLSRIDMSTLDYGVFGKEEQADE